MVTAGPIQRQKQPPWRKWEVVVRASCFSWLTLLYFCVLLVSLSPAGSMGRSLKSSRLPGMAHPYVRLQKGLLWVLPQRRHQRLEVEGRQPSSRSGTLFFRPVVPAQCSLMDICTITVLFTLSTCMKGSGDTWWPLSQWLSAGLRWLVLGGLHKGSCHGRHSLTGYQDEIRCYAGAAVLGSSWCRHFLVNIDWSSSSHLCVLTLMEKTELRIMLMLSESLFVAPADCHWGFSGPGAARDLDLKQLHRGHAPHQVNTADLL